MLRDDKFTTGEDYYHQLNLVFNLLIAIPLVPFAVLYLADLKDSLPKLPLSDDVKMVIDVTLLFIAIMISVKGYRDYQNSRVTIVNEEGLRTKMTLLKVSLWKMYFSLTISSVMFALGLFVTQSKIHIVAFVVVLVLLSLRRPSLKMIVEELRLPPEEADVLRTKEPIK